MLSPQIRDLYVGQSVTVNGEALTVTGLFLVDDLAAPADPTAEWSVTLTDKRGFKLDTFVSRGSSRI